MNYDQYWKPVKTIRDPADWPTWSLLEAYVLSGKERLEIGPGVRPKFPVEGTVFLDTSPVAIERLAQLGGMAVVHDAQQKLPFPEERFDLIGAFEVLEHTEDDLAIMREIWRVLKPAGYFIFSVPAFKEYWSAWDAFVGHRRRYDPKILAQLLEECGFEVERFCAFKNAAYWFQRTPAYRVCTTVAVFAARRFPGLFAKAVDDVGFGPVVTLMRLTKNKGLVCWEPARGTWPDKNVTNIMVVCKKQ